MISGLSAKTADPRVINHRLGPGSLQEITKGESTERPVGFFRLLHGSVKVVAMQAINNVYLLRRPQTAIPKPFLDEIQEIAHFGSGSVQEIASWFLDRAESPE